MIPGNGSSSHLVDVEQIDTSGHSISAGHINGEQVADRQ